MIEQQEPGAALRPRMGKSRVVGARESGVFCIVNVLRLKRHRCRQRMRLRRIVVDDEGESLSRIGSLRHDFEQRGQRRTLSRGLAIENNDCGKVRGLNHRRQQVVRRQQIVIQLRKS